MPQSYDIMWENALEELNALVATEEYEGYGAMRTLRCYSSSTICAWWYQIVDMFNVDREVVSVALNYFDRYIYKKQSSGYPLVPYKLEFIAMTSITLAMKSYSMGDKESVSRARAEALGIIPLANNNNPFTAREILETEKEMLSLLDWRMNPPTVQQFAMIYIKLHPLSEMDPHLANYLYEMARYQAERAIFVPELMMKYKPSVLAYAALLRAGDKLDKRLLTKEMKERFFGLEEIVNMSSSHVLEAVCCLGNNIPWIPSVEEFLCSMMYELDPPRTVPVVTTNGYGYASPRGMADI